MDTLSTDTCVQSWWTDEDGIEKQSLNSLIDSIPILMAYVSADLKYQFVNKTFEKWFCIPRDKIIGMTFGDYLPKEVADASEVWAKVLAGSSQKFNKRIDFPDGRTRWLKVHAVPRFSRDKTVSGFFLSCEDQTGYQNRKSVLVERETELRTILDNILEGVIVTDDRGNIEMFSRSAERMFGRRSTYMLGKNLRILMPQSIANRHDDYIARYNKTGKGKILGVGGRELEALHKDGTRFPIELTIGKFDAGQGQKFIGCVRDISFRKETLESLRAVSSRLINAMETERRRIALELHDDLSQRLALFSVELDLLAANLPETREETLEKLARLQATARQTTSAVHKMSHELHPAMLEQLGLASAVASYCREVSSRSNVQVHYECEGPLPALGTTNCLSLYRVVQEAVQNILKHSGASEAWVSIASDGNQVRIEIVDCGQGFDAPLETAAGLGFVSMKERLAQIGGQLDIQSREGQGTTIVATTEALME